MKKIFFTLFGLLIVKSFLNAQTVRTPENFSKINIASAFNVELQQAAANKIEISGLDDEYVGSIATEVKNNTLYIYAKKKIIATSATKIIVYFVDIESLMVSGASSVKNNEKLQFSSFEINLSSASNLNFNADYTQLKAKVSGASELILKGNTTNLNIESSGASTVKAGGLIAKNIQMNVSGASTAVFYAENSIVGEVSGASDVKIVGNPLKSNVSQSGASTVNGITKAPISNDEFSTFSSKKTDLDTTTFKWRGYKIFIFEEDTLYKSKGGYQSFRRSHWAGLDLGINGFAKSSSDLNLANTPQEFANPKDITEFMEVKLSKSWTFSLNFYEKYIPIVKHNVGLVTGLGIEWNNYELRNNVRLISNGGAFVNDTLGFNNDYTWGVVDSLRDYSKNRFKTVMVNLPLLVEFNTSKNYHKSAHIAVGAIVGWNIHTKMKYKYKENGETIKEKVVQDFNTNPFRLSLTARVGIGYFNVFATYSITQLFEDNKGPEIYPFSVGVTLLSF